MLARPATRFFVVLAIFLGLGSIANAEILTGAAASREAATAARELAKVETLTADFDMMTANGINQGQIYVDRSRQAMRVEFDPPLDDLLLVNGPLTQYFGGDGTAIQTATTGTPLAFLLDPEQALKSSVDVLQVEKRQDDLTIALAETGNKEGGQIILQFTGSGPWRLKQWGMFDQDGKFSQTRLKNVRTGVSIDASRFEAPPRSEKPD